MEERIAIAEANSKRCFVPFTKEIEEGKVPTYMNNPFVVEIPEICHVAVKELQTYLLNNQSSWEHDFGNNESVGGKGKMFGVLVVRTEKGQLGYLSTFSGKIADEVHDPLFVPSIFDVSTDNYFINRGMTELTELSHRINSLSDVSEIKVLKEVRKNKSIELQQKLFDSYRFLNQNRVSKSLCDIFTSFGKKAPPAGAGECAAPKLLHYAFANQMEPLGIAEFWWGKSPKSGDRVHKSFYPSCRDKCVPILGHMLSASNITKKQ